MTQGCRRYHRSTTSHRKPVELLLSFRPFLLILPAYNHLFSVRFIFLRLRATCLWGSASPAPLGRPTSLTSSAPERNVDDGGISPCRSVSSTFSTAFWIVQYPGALFSAVCHHCVLWCCDSSRFRHIGVAVRFLREGLNRTRDAQCE